MSSFPGNPRLVNSTLWLCIDHFWLLVRCNFLTLVLFLPIVTFPIGLAGVLGVCRALTTKREGSFQDYAAGIGQETKKMYGWTLALLAWWGWCFLAYRFCCAFLPPASSRAGIFALIFLFAALGNALFYIALPAVAQNNTLKGAVVAAAQMLAARPLSCLKFILAVIVLKTVLLLSGVGILLLGFACLISIDFLFWMDYRHRAFGEPEYVEDRSLKDFFVPANLLR